MSKDGVATYKNLSEPYLVQKLVIVRLVGSPPFIDKRVSGDVVRAAAAAIGVRPILATSSSTSTVEDGVLLMATSEVVVEVRVGVDLGPDGGGKGFHNKVIPNRSVLKGYKQICEIICSLIIKYSSHKSLKGPSPITPFALRSKKGTRVNTALL